jgi:hypothetical protein
MLTRYGRENVFRFAKVQVPKFITIFYVNNSITNIVCGFDQKR